LFEYRDPRPLQLEDLSLVAFPADTYSFRMYSNAFRYVPISRFGEPPDLRLRRPTISSYLLRAAQHVIFTVHSFYSAMHYFIYVVSCAFRNPRRLNRVIVPTCREIDRVSYCSSGFTLSQLYFRNTKRAAAMLHARRFINLAFSVALSLHRHLLP